METRSTLVLIAVVIVSVYSQSLNDLDVNDGLKKLEENIPELQNFNKSSLPNAEDVEKVLREKCEKNGGHNAIDLLKDEQETTKTCVEEYVNTTLIQEELEQAKKTGSMDEVFGKYCKKWPQIHACFDNATQIARQCMDDNEEKAFNKSLVILADLQEFLCFKDGDRLAMFVAEGGIECVQEKREGIQYCFNATLGSRMPDPSDLSISTIPTFLYSTEDCQDFDEIRHCVNVELEKCKDSTPANIIDAFFKFLKKQMPCQVTKIVHASTLNSASSMAVSTVFLVLTALALRM